MDNCNEKNLSNQEPFNERDNLATDVVDDAQEIKSFATCDVDDQQDDISTPVVEMEEKIVEKPVINYPYINDTIIKKASFTSRLAKRTFDIISSFFVILLLSSLLILPLLTIVVAVKMKGNPFFVQVRPGKDGKVFKMIKFRTMTNEKDANGELLPDDIRLTRFGKFLRKTSLDEIPELFNILFGKMSVVGPRPQLVRDMVYFSQDAMRRQSVRPGLTGYAQTHGRNNITWEQKFDLDLEYLSKQSFWLDIKIIFLTVGKVFKLEDVATDGLATAEDYGAYLLREGAITKEMFENSSNVAQEIINGKS